MEMYQNNRHLVSGDSNSDMDTYLDSDLSSMNSTMPAPGNGTNNSGDSPQEVLFIVTDALNDDTPSRTYAPMDWSGTNCTAIKNRGHPDRGALHHLLSRDQRELVPATRWCRRCRPGCHPACRPSRQRRWARTRWRWRLQQCASSGLYYQVSTDGDISSALQTLFQEAVATARLTS